MQPENMTLVSMTPADLPAVQSSLRDWCAQKIAAVRTELSDLQKNLEIAKRNKWKHSGLAAAVGRTQKRVHFYAKIKAAIEAGYLIVPNFPVELFAVRVQRAEPKVATARYRSSSVSDAKPELLPAGEGRYVDDTHFVSDESYTQTQPDGKEKRIARFVTAGYDELDFPVRPVKPIVLEAAARALSLKIFDQLGIVRQTKKDPIVVGQLLDPRGGDRLVTFFVAWWLDTDSL